MKKSVSLIISAYNEEKNIQAAIESADDLMRNTTDDYELLVFNDGSQDQTGVIADRLAKTNRHIRVVHNPGNRGISYIARKGIEIASKDYVTWFPGDNGIDKESMKPVIKAIGSADIIVSYIANRQCRALGRRILSWTFTTSMNLIFGLRLKYYNGPTVYPTRLLKPLKMTSQGFEFFAELLIRFLKSGGYSYVEIPFFIPPTDPQGRSKAVSWKNVKSIWKTTNILIRDIYAPRMPKIFQETSKSHV